MNLRLVIISFFTISLFACGQSKSKDNHDNSNELLNVEPKDANIDQLTAMIEKAPGNPECYYYRGLRNMDQEDYTMAIKDFDECIALDSTNAVSWFNRGTSYFSLNNLDAALRDYNKALTIEPTYVDAYFNRGVLFDTKEEYAKAIEDYNKALQNKPDFWDAMYYRGLDYLLLKNKEKACDDFKTLSEKNYEDGMKAYNDYCLNKKK
jgi:tetratricopeptide (TPR) repeat protein